MSNTATAEWPAAQPGVAPLVASGPQWTFYTQVSVSGPSVCTTVHRGESLGGTRATLTRDDIVPEEDDFRDPDVTAQRRDDDRQWGPWSLTQRELEVLQLLAEGATNGEISQRLYISPKTTKNHLAAIFQKLDVTNRTHALVRAVVMGLVTIE
ncbi:MAG TPA: response regulator transcription factor [Acidimicrobiales bacterium]|jgi:DNA-binding CsgD family transcriptional regulator|nr:response regulator transcription factor [Acidimicrobiales bacterium]